MKHQALCPIALMLSVLLATAVPAQAGTLYFADVLRAGAGGRRGDNPDDLRLRSLQQHGAQVAAGVSAPQGKGNSRANTSSGSASAPDTSSVTTSFIGQDPAQQGGTVETIDLGDVTGTVCDCGEIAIDIPAAGFPLWPLAGLAGIPLFFIDTDDNPPRPPPPPPPPPPSPEPIPEPATLLLFGTGLLAVGARTRRRRSLKSLGAEASEEVV